MKKFKLNAQNIFFIIGFLALVIMVWAIGLNEIVSNVCKTGWWFLAIIGMWLPIYLINTLAFVTIVRDEDPANHKASFLHIFKINLSGFALKAATPLGFLGGDPYKIIEFRALFGVEKATSSVVLYSMTHMTAHFLFWTLAILATVAFLPVPLNFRIFLLGSFVFFTALLYLLWRGYRKGMTVRFFHICCKLPYLKRWVLPFFMKYNDKLILIDHQISHLYNKRRKAFLKTLALEFFARVCNCLEVYVILLTVTSEVTLIQSVVIYTFMSLFTNILFFSPMQVGTREGGFLIAFRALSLSGGLGIYVSLVTRVRELFWMGVGILLMKVHGKTSTKLPVDS
ncbi:MAG: flippase-like domain-containing protein [Bacteroidales bacterium]|nr:flippase-like domain-containing protein [Bacteroidales bacterium]